MANNYFSFKEFTIYQDGSVFRVGTDGVLLGASTDVTGVAEYLILAREQGLYLLCLRKGAMLKLFLLNQTLILIIRLVKTSESANGVQGSM